MSAEPMSEQKKSGRGRIERNLPSMTEDSYDMDKIAQGGTASKIPSSPVPPKEEVQGLPTKNCNSVANLPKNDGAQTSEAEVLLGKPFVYKKRESGYGELATNVRASLEKWNAGEKATEESTGSMPLTAGSVADSEVAWLFGNDHDEIVDDGEDSGEDIEIVEVDDDEDRRVDLVRAVDVARNSHRWGVGEKRDGRVAGRDDESGPNGLLPKILVHDPVLHSGHEILAEVANHGRVDASGHDPEGVASRDEATMRRQVFEATTDDADSGQVDKAAAECVAHRLVGMNQKHSLDQH